MAGELNSLPEDPGRTPTTGARHPSGAGRTSTLMEPLMRGTKVYPSPLYGERLDVAPPFDPPRVEAVGSASRTVVGERPAGRGSSRPLDALSLEWDKQHRRE